MFNNLFNVFPDFLNYGLLAPTILRIILGVIVINLGYLKIRSEKERWIELFETLNFRPAHIFLKVASFVEIVGGIMLIIGAYTQVVALIFAITYVCEAILDYEEESLVKRNLPFYILLCAISVSLLLTGAGLFAVDIPGL
jgi:putative oxidoreductase